MFRLPSPSLTVSMTALVIALGGAGFAATGGNFILGHINSAENQSGIVSPVAGKMLLLNNTSNDPAATALGLTVKPGHPPLIVNSATKVPQLNVDQLDDLDSSDFGQVLKFSYNLPAGAVTPPIEVPVDTPLFLVGNQLEVGFRGVGFVSLLSVTNVAAFLEWTGLESTAGSTITQGFSGAFGTHIVFLDFAHQVDVEVFDATHIQVHNSSGGVRSGNVTIFK